VTGFVRRIRSVRKCVACGAVDEATLDLAEAVRGADLLVFCTPLARMKTLARQLAPHLKPGALVTDVGSVKASVIRDVESVVARAGAHFVGSHPMAGSEKAGVLAARADLFAGAICIVTPTAKTRPAALKRAETLWKALGCRTLRTTPEAHDQLVSRSSHLPYLSSVALTNYILDPAHSTVQGLLCAAGFRDTTRIASSSPEMWRDIALANRRHLRKALAGYMWHLAKLGEMLRRGEGEELAACFQKAKTLRDAWLAGASSRLPK
jgi:prephenate dehydrogenase